MKKYFTSQKWKKVQGFRKDYRRNRRLRKERNKGKNVVENSRRRNFPDLRRSPPQTVVAPAIFSIVNNANEFLKFLSTIESLIKNHKNISIDMENLQQVTPDAVVVLLSKIREANDKKCHIQGSNPKDPAILQYLASCDFFSHVRSRHSLAKPSSTASVIYRTINRVDANVADQIITQAFNKAHQSIPLKNQQFIQQVAIELMGNAVEHSKKNGLGTCWMGYSIESSNKVIFVFHDNGIGILKSIRQRMKDKLKPDTAIVQELFETELAKFLSRGTKDKLKGRGNGLRRIYERVKEGVITNLHIVTNDVFGDVSNQKYHRTSIPLHGTLLTWEYRNEIE